MTCSVADCVCGRCISKIIYMHWRSYIWLYCENAVPPPKHSLSLKIQQYPWDCVSSKCFKYVWLLFSFQCFQIVPLENLADIFCCRSCLIGLANLWFKPCFHLFFVLILNHASIHPPQIVGKIYIFISCNKLAFKVHICVVLDLWGIWGYHSPPKTDPWLLHVLSS